MNMNCLFIDTGTEKVLIETGIGEKWSEKQNAMYGIDRKRPFAASLEAIAGCRPADITIVINTHLHFDHAGGNTVLSSPPYEGGVAAASAAGVVLSSEPLIVPQFPNARYLVSKSEFNHAEHPHERDRASYLPENWLSVQESGQLELMPDSYEPVEGLRIEQARGHSETMQTVRLERGGGTLYGFADLIPMRQHLPLAWVAGFDLYPVETLAFKKRILPQALAENWLCLFYHDPEMPICQLAEVNGKLVAEKVA